MNFASAITSLRDGRCAKTPAMRGYVSRSDCASPSEFPTGHGLTVKTVNLAASTVGTAISIGDLVLVTGGASSSQNGFFRSSAAYASTDAIEAFSMGSDDRTYLFLLSFVENPGYQDADGDSTGSAANPYVFLAEQDYDRRLAVHTAPSADLVVDRELLGLLCSQDWDVYDTGSAASAASSTARW